MAQNGYLVASAVDEKTYDRLLMISFVQKNAFGNKVTVSSIIRDALHEYFENHPDQIETARTEYLKRGVDVDI